MVASGSRNSCFDDFRTALDSHPEAFNILLVDAEDAVSTTPRQHLQDRDGWDIHTSEENCQLMVQTMEAWLVADLEAFRSYYGQRFLTSAIPRSQNVEEIDKTALKSALDNATRNTQKGEYHKIRHGADLLTRIDPTVVRGKAQHCDRLFLTLAHLMQGIPPQ